MWGEPMEPLQEKRQVHPRNTLRKDLPPILLLVAVTFLLFSAPVVLSLLPELDSCSSTDRVTTPDAALAFAKDYIRQNKRIWETLGATSSDDLESILGPRLCWRWDRGAYFWDGDSHWSKPDYWKIYISWGCHRPHDEFHAMYFSECKRNPYIEGPGELAMARPAEEFQHRSVIGCGQACGTGAGPGQAKGQPTRPSQ
jgi:hypothetical protein